VLKFQHQIRVIPPRIRLETCSRCSNAIPSTTRRALSNSVISFSKAQSLFFGSKGGATGNMTIFTEKLITPFDRARRVVLGIALEHLEHVPKRIRGEITRIWCWNFNTKLQYFDFFGTIV
jgi:hypothetical protein